MQQRHHHRLRASQRESQRERERHERRHAGYERKQRVGGARDKERSGQNLEFREPARDPRHRQPHNERRGGERGQNDADERRRKPQIGAVDRNEKSVQIPGHRQEPVDNEDASQVAIPQQVDDAAGAGEDVRRSPPRQCEPPAGQDRCRHERQQRQTDKGRGKARMIDQQTDDERPAESGYRVPEREQAEVSGPIGRRAQRTGRLLGGDLKQHERKSDERRRDEQRRQAGEDPRQHCAHRNAAGAREHRATNADAVGHSSCADCKQHRQERIKTHQRADDERRCAERQRVQRHRNAAAGERGVIEHGQHDQCRKCARAMPRRANHGARRSSRQRAPSRRYRRRSCKREARPCQNSTDVGATR